MGTEEKVLKELGWTFRTLCFWGMRGWSEPKFALGHPSTEISVAVVDSLPSSGTVARIGVDITAVLHFSDDTVVGARPTAQVGVAPFTCYLHGYETTTLVVPLPAGLSLLAEDDLAGSDVADDVVALIDFVPSRDVVTDRDGISVTYFLHDAVAGSWTGTDVGVAPFLLDEGTSLRVGNDCNAEEHDE